VNVPSYQLKPGDVLKVKPANGVTDVTPIPHNGCRPPKRRRV